MAEQAVVVQHHLPIDSQKLAFAGHHKGVDFGKRSIAADKGIVQPLGDLGELPYQTFVKTDAKGKLAGLKSQQPEERIDSHLDDLFGGDTGDLFDLDAAFRRSHHHHSLAVSVDHSAEVDFVLDVRGFVDQDFLDRKPFDLHAEDLPRYLLRFVRGSSQLDASGLASPTNQHLCLHHDWLVETLGDRSDFLRRGSHFTSGNGHTILSELSLRLILL